MLQPVVLEDDCVHEARQRGFALRKLFGLLAHKIPNGIACGDFFHLGSHDSLPGWVFYRKKAIFPKRLLFRTRPRELK